MDKAKDPRERLLDVVREIGVDEFIRLIGILGYKPGRNTRKIIKKDLNKKSEVTNG